MWHRTHADTLLRPIGPLAVASLVGTDSSLVTPWVLVLYGLAPDVSNTGSCVRKYAKSADRGERL